ncbi:MAG TPA: flagellar biosynthesis protein FlhF [Burkholderiales bacterium]|nr:flagellar biosynthesis protein FlhF [Burkholderiales bacterium]
MNVQKFIANSAREALRQVRDALGPDAVILSNRSVPGGVEIVALASEDIASLVSPTTEKEAEPLPDLMAFVPPAPAIAAKRRNQATDLADLLQTSRSTQAAAAPNSAEPHAAAELAGVMQEIRAMRSMLEMQLSEIAWGATQNRQPHRSGIMRELLSTGFTPSLSRHLTENLPEVKNLQEGISWVKTVLARNLIVKDNENEILEKGGVFALVGPTGVGKTTTTAKLAARCVMRHGASKLALITTDGYRIGGHEQLRIYGKILGVMVHSVKDESDLRIALEELKNKHTVLIDTVGMNQRDQMVAEQVAMLSGAGTPVKRLLCLNATSTGETLTEVVRAYQGTGLSGCIITKLDEAATMGNVIDVIIRHKLTLYYAANGQRVPEDLHLMNRELLIDRAFRQKRETHGFQFQDDELALVVSGAARASQDHTLREVNFG